MMRYRFVSVDNGNIRHEGVVDAASPDEVAGAEADAGRLLLELRPESSARRLWAFLNQDISAHARIADRDLAILARSWSGFLSAGISIDEALHLTLETTRRAKLRDRLARVAEWVRGGATLRASLEREGGFPPIFIALAGAGELSGTLPDAMDSIATQMERSREFVEKIRSALIYPAFLTVTASGAILVLLTVVVPNLQSLVEGQDASTLPAMTQAALAASSLIRTQGLWILAAIVTLLVVAILALRTPSGRRLAHRSILAIPLVGPLVVAANWSRYCRTLSALIAGGVSLATALPLALVTVANLSLQQEFARAHERVLSGSLLASALDRSRHRSRETLALIRMGEKTGRLHQALGHAATLLERSVQQTLERGTTLVGPVLTLVFGAVAGVVVYAMLSTILSINEFAFH